MRKSDPFDSDVTAMSVLKELNAAVYDKTFHCLWKSRDFKKMTKQLGEDMIYSALIQKQFPVRNGIVYRYRSIEAEPGKTIVIFDPEKTQNSDPTAINDGIQLTVAIKTYTAFQATLVDRLFDMLKRNKSLTNDIVGIISDMNRNYITLWRNTAFYDLLFALDSGKITRKHEKKNDSGEYTDVYRICRDSAEQVKNILRSYDTKISVLGKGDMFCCFIGEQMLRTALACALRSVLSLDCIPDYIYYNVGSTREYVKVSVTGGTFTGVRGGLTDGYSYTGYDEDPRIRFLKRFCSDYRCKIRHHSDEFLSVTEILLPKYTGAIPAEDKERVSLKYQIKPGPTRFSAESTVLSDFLIVCDYLPDRLHKPRTNELPPDPDRKRRYKK